MVGSSDAWGMQCFCSVAFKTAKTLHPPTQTSELPTSCINPNIPLWILELANNLYSKNPIAHSAWEDDKFIISCQFKSAGFRNQEKEKERHNWT